MVNTKRLKQVQDEMKTLTLLYNKKKAELNKLCVSIENLSIEAYALIKRR